MSKKTLPDLVIGDLVINPPIIQGGMGVRVSTAPLAAAVSNTGALGVIASVGLGGEEESARDYVVASAEALAKEIRQSMRFTQGYIGINIMSVLTNFESLVKTSITEGANVIFSGAGLPLKLPVYCEGSSMKIAPIVSSVRALSLICETWRKKYNRLPDAVVLEGAQGGGHLGFRFGELISGTNESLEEILKGSLEFLKQYESNTKIPVVVGGGVFTGGDIAKMLKLGASGVQMATRFVCTDECSVSDRYKEAYLKCKKEDIAVILSPVGLPARVIRNDFVDRIESGEKIKFSCPYKCLRTCDPLTVNYCIADVLVNASRGDLDNGYVMCAGNAYRVESIVSVKELIDELVRDALQALK